MTEQDLNKRVERALVLHKMGYNCAQSVACVFSDQVDLSETDIFRITEGLGAGMGSMDGTCGAISAAAILAGLTNSTAHLDHPDSKAKSQKSSKICMARFLEQNGSVTCRDLKGIDTKQPLRSCDGCIEDAVRIVAAELF